MRTWLGAAWLAAGVTAAAAQAPDPKDWIDPDTGHRIVRLTDEGGSTLYFHDNAFSQGGDTFIVNTPGGLAMGEVAAIGTSGAGLTIVAPGVRGGYFARRTREIYFTGRGGAPVTALNVDTRQTRSVPYVTDGRWVNLLRVQPDGTVARERLVNMSRHNYVTGRGGVEPNAHITPDKKWAIFTGQFAPGRRQVYAVQIDKAWRRPGDFAGLDPRRPDSLGGPAKEPDMNPSTATRSGNPQ